MNNIIVVRSVTEFEKLPKGFSDFTLIEIRIPSTEELSISQELNNASISLYGDSRVNCHDNSRVRAFEESRVNLYDTSHAEINCQSSALLFGFSTASVWRDGHAELWDSSRAEVYDDGKIKLFDNSNALLFGRAIAELWGNSCAKIHTEHVKATLFSNSVVHIMAHCSSLKNKNIKKSSKTARIIKSKNDISKWFTDNGVKSSKAVILYKRVSSDFLTQEGTSNETSWKVGSTGVHPKWDPGSGECGAGKFHAVSHPYLADEFRKKPDDRYIALSIKREDLYAWHSPNYPHKIAFRAYKVLYECDRFGNKI